MHLSVDLLSGTGYSLGYPGKDRHKVRYRSCSSDPISCVGDGLKTAKGTQAVTPFLICILAQQDNVVRRVENQMANANPRLCLDRTLCVDGTEGGGALVAGLLGQCT
jgi:hypothetical protein